MTKKPSAKVTRGITASPTSKRTVTRSATTGAFKRGSSVRVPLGARTYDATVLEERNGRVRVSIDVRGSDEQVTSSYAVEDLRSAS